MTDDGPILDATAAASLTALITEAMAIADRYGMASVGIWLDRALVGLNEAVPMMTMDGPAAPLAAITICDPHTV